MKFGVKNNLCLLCASVAGVLLFCSIFSYFPAFAENIDKININLVKKIGIQRNSVFISKQDIEEIILDGKKILQQKNIENTTTYEINEINNELNLMKISPGYHALQLKFKNISSPVYLPFRLHEKWSNKDKIKAFIYVNKKGELLETENGYDLDMNDNIDDNNDWFRTQTISVKGKIGGLNKRERTLYWYNANKKELRKILLKEEDFFKVVVKQAFIIMENSWLYNKVKSLAVTDSLTGIYNHGFLYECLCKEYARAERYKLPLSFLMLDMDYFKKVNDSYGHPQGDTVLCKISRILRNNVRVCDTIGRYGGEEFSIILPESKLEDSVSLAERIRKEVEQYNFGDVNKVIKCTASIGVSSYPCPDVKNLEDLINKADRALYNAKAEGRNRVCII